MGAAAAGTRVRVNGLAMEMRLNEYYSDDDCKWHYLARGNNYFVYGATLRCISGLTLLETMQN